jgi:ribosomal protein L40E
MSASQKGRPKQWSQEGRERVKATQFKRIIGTPICRKCSVLLTSDNWFLSLRKEGGQNRICKKCYTETTNIWKQQHKERINERKRQRRAEIKRLIKQSELIAA